MEGPRSIFKGLNKASLSDAGLNLRSTRPPTHTMESAVDPSLFVRSKSHSRVIYMDDMIIIGDDDVGIHFVKHVL